MGETLNKLFQMIDSAIGPSKKDYKPACHDVRDMLSECVLESDCFKENQNFKYCLQDGINKECKAIRYDYQLCRRSQVNWAKHFSKDDPRWSYLVNL